MKYNDKYPVENNKIYPPNNRDFYEPEEHDLKSYSPNGDFTILPNPNTDPIVSNNISNVEFDYTDQSMFKE